jgi:hypothetical protein
MQPRSASVLLDATLAGTTLADLFAMRTLALQVIHSDPDHVREDAFTTAVFAARARRQATSAEVAQVQVRTSLHLAYMTGERGEHALSATAAEVAAGRDREYLRAKAACAEAIMVARGKPRPPVPSGAKVGEEAPLIMARLRRRQRGTSSAETVPPEQEPAPATDTPPRARSPRKTDTSQPRG